MILGTAACGSSEEAHRPPDAPAEPATGEAARPAEGTEPQPGGDGTVPMPPTTQKQRCPAGASEYRIGDFETPEEGKVPPYEGLEEGPVERDCAGAISLLVDTW